MTAVTPGITSARRQWLEERRKGIGASDVAAIGQVPGAYGSPWSVWADKAGLTPLDDDPDDDDPRTFGLDLEPVIIKRFESATDLWVVGLQEVARYPAFPRWFATLDGYVSDSGHVSDPHWLGVFESKYTASAPWDDVPEHYLWQLQWQMMCAQQDRAWLAALFLPFGRPRFRIYEVARDDLLIDRIQAVVAHFWNEHVVTGDPPPPDDHPATAATIDALYAHLDTEAFPRLELDDYRDLVDDLAHWRKAKADAARHEKHAATRLRAVWSAEQPELSEGFVDGELAVSWRAQSDTRVDVEAVRADHGDKYDRTQTVRVLRLHGKRLA